MIEIKKYSPEYKELWDFFIKNSKNGLFMFERDFMEYHSDRFQDNSLMFFEDDKLLALLPMNIVENQLFSHRGLTFGGFVSDQNMKAPRMLKYFEKLTEYMKDNSLNTLIYKAIPYIYHFLPAQEDIYALFQNNAKLLKTEISTTIQLDCIPTLKKGRKAQINRAKREGVIIELSENFEEFMKLESEILDKKYNTKPTHTVSELRLLYSRFPQNIKFYVSKLHEEIIAGVLLFEYKNVVHTQYMATNEKGREIGGLDFLIKKLLEIYKDSKKYFDFGISTENGGQYLNEGLIAQKESFGGRAIVHQTWKLSV